MEKTFKQFLEEKHVEEYPGILDDELSDALDEWLSELSPEDFIKYADEYVAEQKEEIRRLVVEDVPHKFQDRLLKALKDEL